MDRSVEHIEFVMYRPNLDALPDAPLPEGFSIRTLQDGHREHWAAIEMSAGEFSTMEKARSMFDNQFGSELDLVKERMLFLEEDGVGPIGTTTAWFGDFRGERIGMIHWVALEAEYHGRGLSRPLLRAALEHMRQFHSAAHLHTQTYSWRAIGLYESFGFERVDETEDEHRGWAIVDEKLAQRVR